MKNRKTFFALAMLLAVLTLGIGYAAISNVNLKIEAGVEGAAQTENFKVRFVKDGDAAPKITTTVNYPTDVSAKAIVSEGNTLAGEIEVKGLSTAGDKAIATFNVENVSEALGAALTLDTDTASDANYNITAEINKDFINPVDGEYATVTITVELLKTIIDERDYDKEFTFVVTATPEQPR